MGEVIDLDRYLAERNYQHWEHHQQSAQLLLERAEQRLGRLSLVLMGQESLFDESPFTEPDNGPEAA